MQLPVLTSHSELQIGEDTPAESLIEWTLERFANQRMVITTGFGMEGCALIEMYAAHGKPLDVIYLDTGFFFPETYRLIDEIKARYPQLNFINCGTMLTPEEQALHYGDQLWKRDPDLCCQLRKVDPMREALSDVDVWVTALRRSQGPSRADLKVIEWNWKYQVLKINPLARWSRQEVRNFVQSRGVPYNELHDRGYPSVGCTHCTQAVPGLSVERYSREGRWAGTEKTECGL
ncbi:phosphoadenylyl-sulfate reductase, partial [Acidobacteria bacterium AH-259-D05]|nr:phosphoadenylyl-sulfate reductase [Acidobacteria bacterium AH-259-D05]